MKHRSIYIVCLILSAVVPDGVVSAQPVSPEFPTSIGIGADVSVVDAIWTGTLQARISVTVDISSQFGVRFPLTCCMDRSDPSLWFLDTGIFLDHHPWGDGPFISVALAQCGGFVGRNRPERSLYFLNEVLLGWTWRIGAGARIEPTLIIRDPSGGFEDEYAAIRDQLPACNAIRFSLTVGWEFHPKLGVS